MEERRSSSPAPPRKATPVDWLLAFPEKRPRGFRRPPGRAERVFNVLSIAVLVLFAMGWSWSIARARASGDSGPVTPASANIANALTDRSAPSVAYLTDAALTALARPARGESGKLRVRIQQGGTPITPILGDTLPRGAVATFSSGSAAESTSTFVAPQRPGIWNLALKVGSAIKPLADFSVITLRPAKRRPADSACTTSETGPRRERANRASATIPPMDSSRSRPKIRTLSSPNTSKSGIFFHTTSRTSGRSTS